jgi:hypothetical protein
MVRVTTRWRCLVLLATLVAAVIPSRAAAAGTIGTVTLGPSGPDQDLPLGSSFYLQGNADASVQAVAPVFVEYSFKVWNIAPSFTCAEVSQALGQPPPSSPIFNGSISNGKVSHRKKRRNSLNRRRSSRSLPLLTYLTPPLTPRTRVDPIPPDDCRTIRWSSFGLRPSRGRRGPW